MQTAIAYIQTLTKSVQIRFRFLIQRISLRWSSESLLVGHLHLQVLATYQPKNAFYSSWTFNILTGLSRGSWWHFAKRLKLGLSQNVPQIEFCIWPISRNTKESKQQEKIFVGFPQANFPIHLNTIQRNMPSQTEVAPLSYLLSGDGDGIYYP